LGYAPVFPRRGPGPARAWIQQQGSGVTRGALDKLLAVVKGRGMGHQWPHRRADAAPELALPVRGGGGGAGGAV